MLLYILNTWGLGFVSIDNTSLDLCWTLVGYTVASGTLLAYKIFSALVSLSIVSVSVFSQICTGIGLVLHSGIRELVVNKFVPEESGSALLVASGVWSFRLAIGHTTSFR